MVNTLISALNAKDAYTKVINVVSSVYHAMWNSLVHHLTLNCFFLLLVYKSAADGDLLFIIAGISLIILSKNETLYWDRACHSSEYLPSSVYCARLIEKGATLSSTSAAAACSGKQQLSVLARKRQTAVRLLSTNFALLIAEWPSLNPIELNLYTFIAALLTAVSH